MHGQNHIKVK